MEVSERERERSETIPMVRKIYVSLVLACVVASHSVMNFGATKNLFLTVVIF